MVLTLCQTEAAVALLCASTVGANPTVELEESLRRMTLPDPTLPLSRPEDITSLYPYFVDFLRNSVRSFNPHHTQFYSTRGMCRRSKTKTQSTITTSGSTNNISNGYYSFMRSTAPLLLLFLLFSVWDRN